MGVDRTLRYNGSYQGAMVLQQRLEDQGVHVELPRQDRKRLEQAQQSAQQWRVLMKDAELLERQDREQRELLQRLVHEPRELRTRWVPELRELDRRHNRERKEVGLPPRVWDAEPWAAEQAPLVSLRQMVDAGLDLVDISLRCTGAAASIAETVKQFRKVAPGCEVEVEGEPHTAKPALLVSLRWIFGVPADGDAVVLAGGPDQSPMDAEVTVVPGVPRYHRSDCILIRLLSHGDLETPTRREAEAAGSVPCKACQPDQPEPSD